MKKVNCNELSNFINDLNLDEISIIETSPLALFLIQSMNLLLQKKFFAFNFKCVVGFIEPIVNFKRVFSIPQITSRSKGRVVA